ncbi:MAG TPA: hypothetical protein DCQ98_05550 [Planctomycetaceae bacterium]|nr:hypothetical protein [Planctomycetaceae bacterium]
MSWHLDGTTATYRSPAGTIVFDLAAPRLGCRIDEAGPAEVWGAIFGNLAPPAPEIEERYVRGSDLVIRYVESPETDLATTVAWRADSVTAMTASGPVVGLSLGLVVAVRTSTLGTQPIGELRSLWPFADARRHWVWGNEAATGEPVEAWHGSAEHPLTWFPDGGSNDQDTWGALVESQRTRLAWLAPADGAFDRNEVVGGDGRHGTAETIQSLRLELLEKGVIRSVSARYVRWPGTVERDELKRIAAEFYDLPLPLSS